MPPKRKKSGKKGKKGKKSGKKSATSIPDSAGPINALSKEFFLVQIRDLEHRLSRYQRKCDELELSNQKFKDNYDQTAADKYEIVTFLKDQLESRGAEITDLNERLVGLQQFKDSEKEKFETEIAELKMEFQETKDQLTSDNLILGGKLTSLEEFKVQKEDLFKKLDHLREELQAQEHDHKESIYTMERKAVVDKDRLKKDMVMRVNKVANEFRKVSNKQMAETTKRTIRENVSINAQLTKMSDKTMELIKENDDLKAKEKRQRQQIDMLETTEKELAKKNHSNQKVIRMLTDKCKQLDGLLQDMEAQERESGEIEAENDLFRQQVEATREELMSLSKENEQLTTDLEKNHQEMRLVKRTKSKLEKILQEAANSIQMSLTSCGSPTWDDEDSSKPDYTEMEKRDYMLEHLLVLLNSAAALGVGPDPGALGKQFKMARLTSASEMPGSKQGFRKGESPLSLVSRGGALPHYQLGDLGLVPKPQNAITTNFEKMRQLSATTRLGGLRKVLTRSVAIQTVSAPKAMFYADQLLSKAPVTTQTDLMKEFLPTRSKPVLGPLQHRKLSPKVY